MWGEALRDANLRRISEELDHAWVALVAEVITDGVGVRRVPAAPTRSPSAWRLCALLDGLGLQVVLHHGTMTRAQMHTARRTAPPPSSSSDQPSEPAPVRAVTPGR